MKKYFLVCLFILFCFQLPANDINIPTYTFSLDFSYQHFSEMSEFLFMSILQNSKLGINNSINFIKLNNIFFGINIGLLVSIVGIIEFPTFFESGLYLSKNLSLSLNIGYLIDLSIFNPPSEYDQFIFGTVKILYKKSSFEIGCSYCLNDYDFEYTRYKISLRTLFSYKIVIK